MKTFIQISSKIKKVSYSSSSQENAHLNYIFIVDTNRVRMVWLGWCKIFHQNALDHIENVSYKLQPRKKKQQQQLKNFKTQMSFQSMMMSVALLFVLIKHFQCWLWLILRSSVWPIEIVKWQQNHKQLIRFEHWPHLTLLWQWRCTYICRPLVKGRAKLC